jgi:hypothetical protein
LTGNAKSEERARDKGAMWTGKLVKTAPV